MNQKFWVVNAINNNFEGYNHVNGWNFATINMSRVSDVDDNYWTGEWYVSAWRGKKHMVSITLKNKTKARQFIKTWMKKHTFNKTRGSKN